METLKINEPWLKCTRCELWRNRENVVLGAGNPHADIFFLGQNPGFAEDASGRPWSGKGGLVFRSFLARFGWSLETIFSDNAIACAPYVKEEGKQRYKINKPSTAMLAACRERVHEAIYAVDPLVVVALGEVAYRTLTGSTAKTSIGALRQEVTNFRIPGVVKYVTYPLIVTYNPAALINTSGNPVNTDGTELLGGSHKKRGSIWDKFFQDLDYVHTRTKTLKQIHKTEREARTGK